MKRNEFNRNVHKSSVLFFVFLVPLMMGASGGCQEFRTSLVSSLETATSAALNAALTNVFDQLQSSSP